MLKYHNPRYLFRRHEIMRRVKSGECFLEIGPGDLSLAQELLGKFKRGVLIDFNTTDVEQVYASLNRTLKDRLTLIIADFLEYRDFGSRFECVVACEVLEHIQDDRAFLAKVHTHLADSGQLILSVPARQKYFSMDDELVGHYRRYEKKDLGERLMEAGFAHVDVASYGFPFQNFIRLVRIAFARNRRKERGAWDKRKQSQHSAFLIGKGPGLDLLAVLLNKHTLYPFSLIASCFNGLDLGEGYVLSAVKVSR